MLMGFVGACVVLVVGCTGAIWNWAAKRQANEGRAVIKVLRILGVGLGLILIYGGVSQLRYFHAFLAGGYSGTVTFNAALVLSGLGLVVQGFWKIRHQ